MSYANYSLSELGALRQAQAKYYAEAHPDLGGESLLDAVDRALESPPLLRDLFMQVALTDEANDMLWPALSDFMTCKPGDAANELRRVLEELLAGVVR